MDQFDKLMSNKYFVKSLIGTLEKQRKITLSDKWVYLTFILASNNKFIDLTLTWISKMTFNRLLT